jgi:hypothetical protein
MKFSSFTFREKPIDRTLPPDAIENAPQLAERIYCDQCGKPGEACASLKQSFAWALGRGWTFRLNQNEAVVIPARQLVHAADLLDMNIEIFCPPCAGEFE